MSPLQDHGDNLQHLCCEIATDVKKVLDKIFEVCKTIYIDDDDDSDDADETIYYV